MDTPAAEFDVTEDLVGSLLRQQHPDLAVLPLRLVANGWDNAIVRLGEELAVRLPRRAAAAALLEHEQRWLPEVASRVSVAIPDPVRIGLPSELYPWHWSVVRWFDGDTVRSHPRAERSAIAGDLARFIREFQTIAPFDAPANPVRGTPLSVRAETMRERFESGLVSRVDELAAIWRQALAAPVFHAAPRWVHGDLHPANILMRDSELCAVIDFGDITAGDPATDLATAWLTFDAEGRRSFADALEADDATWLRARGWALLLGTALVCNSADNPAMHAMGEDALDELLDE